MKTLTTLGLSCFAALVLAGAAFAEEAPASSAAASAADEPEVMSLDEMGSLSGGTGIEVNVITDGVLTAVNSGNTVTGDTVTSGTLSIGSNAFSGFEGIGNFVMNTGHNNNLQSNMSVSVVMTPPVPGS